MSVSFGVDDALSAVTGNKLDQDFAGLLRLVLKEVQNTVVFGSTLKSFQKTLEKLEPTIKRIKEKDTKLDRREGMKGLKNLLDKGHALVKKCEKVGKLNLMRPYYTYNLEKLIAKIKEFIDFNLQLYTAETVRHTLVQATFSAALGGKTLNTVEQISVCVKRQGVVGDMIYEKLSQQGEKLGEMYGKMTEIQEAVNQQWERSMNRYPKSIATCIPKHDNREQTFSEMAVLRRETRSLQMSLRRYTGEDMSSASYQELEALEHELECAVTKVGHRKYELQQQQDNLRRKERMLEEENSNMHSLIPDNRTALEYQQAREAKSMEHHEILEQFPFCGEPSSVLQLATIPPQITAYHLQLAQPNLEGSGD